MFDQDMTAQYTYPKRRITHRAPTKKEVSSR